MKTMLIGAAIVSLGFVVAPTVRADPGDDQQLVDDMAATGAMQNRIPQTPHALISGAINTVCPSLGGGEPEQNVVAELEQYSGFTRLQAYTYVHDAVRFYCPSDAGKLSDDYG